MFNNLKRNDNILDTNSTLPTNCAIASQMLDVTFKFLIAKHRARTPFVRQSVRQT